MAGLVADHLPTAHLSCQSQIISASDIVWDHLNRKSTHDCTDRSPPTPFPSPALRSRPPLWRMAGQGIMSKLWREAYMISFSSNITTPASPPVTLQPRSDSSNRITD